MFSNFATVFKIALTFIVYLICKITEILLLQHREKVSFYRTKSL